MLLKLELWLPTSGACMCRLFNDDGEDDDANNNDDDLTLRIIVTIDDNDDIEDAYDHDEVHDDDLD